MTSFANAFFADFDAEEEDESTQQKYSDKSNTNVEQTFANNNINNHDNKDDNDGSAMIDSADSEGSGEEPVEDDSNADNLDGIIIKIEEEAQPKQSLSDTSALSTLINDKALQNHLETIKTITTAHSSNNSSPAADSPQLSDQEYQLLITSNRYNVELDNEISLLFHYARALYSARFSELEDLISTALDYARVVLILENSIDQSSSFIEKNLAGIVPPNVILTITITANARNKAKTAQKISAAQLERLKLSCEYIITLHQYKNQLLQHIEARMLLLAPNLSALAGVSVSAQLISIAGGLKKLSEMPACNILVLGNRKNLAGTGFSRVNQQVHVGILRNCGFFLSSPQHLKGKIARLLAGKIVLAARIDQNKQDLSGKSGNSLREKLNSVIAKFLQPPSKKFTKALPVPLPPKRKKRGGRRYRKEKEKLAATELEKAKNKLLFGVAAVQNDFTGENYGSIGVEGTGILKIQGNSRKFGGKLSKKMEKQLKRQKISNNPALSMHNLAGTGGITSNTASLSNNPVFSSVGSVVGSSTQLGRGLTSGTVSTIALDSNAGMQLISPQLQQNMQNRLIQQQQVGYFSNNAKFSKVAQTNGHDNNNNPSVNRILPAVPKFS
jgi:U4/U6 small nuclear ribonucleoprotein PRP31